MKRFQIPFGTEWNQLKNISAFGLLLSKCNAEIARNYFVIREDSNNVSVDFICQITCIHFLLQFKRAYCMVLTACIVIKTAMMSIIQIAFGYVRSVILGFQLKGPPAKFLLGNGPILLDKNCKL